MKVTVAEEMIKSFNSGNICFQMMNQLQQQTILQNYLH